MAWLQHRRNGQMEVYTSVFLLVIWGYRENTPTERARACPKLPKIQLWRAGKTPVAHAGHAHRFVFKDGIWASGAATYEGAKHSPFRLQLGGICPPPKYTKMHVFFTPCWAYFPHFWPKPYELGRARGPDRDNIAISHPINFWSLDLKFWHVISNKLSKTFKIGCKKKNEKNVLLRPAQNFLLKFEAGKSASIFFFLLASHFHVFFYIDSNHVPKFQVIITSKIGRSMAKFPPKCLCIQIYIHTSYISGIHP